MLDPSGQNLRTPPPKEIPKEPAEKDPAPSATNGRLKAVAARGTASLTGALAIVGVVQLAKSPAYLGGASLLAGAVTGIIAALLARKDISLRTVSRLFALAAAGAAAAGIGYVIGFNVYSPPPLSALADIQPIGSSNHDVRAYGEAGFAVTVPSRYNQLTVSFAVTSSPGFPKENCVNGSQESITPVYDAALGSVQEIAPGMAATVQIPQGISSFTLEVVFIPQGGYGQQGGDCHEDIVVTAAQFSN
jgi:hypothetical protein